MKIELEIAEDFDINDIKLILERQLSVNIIDINVIEDELESKPLTAEERKALAQKMAQELRALFPQNTVIVDESIKRLIDSDRIPLSKAFELAKLDIETQRAYAKEFK